MTVRMETQILAHSMFVFDRIKLRLREGKELIADSIRVTQQTKVPCKSKGILT